MRRGVGRRSAWVAAAGVFTACGGPAPDAPGGPLVRDSAGVAIVENRGAAWSDGGGWAVAPEPELILGTLEGPEATQFYQLQAVRLRPDGGVLVPERGRARVSAFDGAGVFLWTQGRQGEGPGEYQYLNSVHLLEGDSALVTDIRARRLSLVGPHGTFVGSVPIPIPDGSLSSNVLGPVEPGRLAMISRASYSGGEGVTDGRLERRQDRLFFATPGGERLPDTLPLLPGSEVWMVATQGSISIAGLPFARTSVAAAGRGRIVTGVSETPELRLWSPEGRLERIVRLPLDPRPVTEDEWRNAFEGRLGDNPDPDELARVREFYEDVPIPAAWPHFMLARIDDRGHTWLQQYDDPGSDEDPARWWVVDPQGVLLGEVVFPSGFRLDDVRGPLAAGRWTDALGVEQVRVYRLQGR